LHARKLSGHIVTGGELKICNSLIPDYINCVSLTTVHGVFVVERTTPQSGQKAVVR
jgi:hypothetical protein